MNYQSNEVSPDRSIGSYEEINETISDLPRKFFVNE